MDSNSDDKLGDDDEGRSYPLAPAENERYIEGEGVVKQVFAQYGVLAPNDVADEPRNWLKFERAEVSVGGERRDLNDLTDMIFPDDRIIFTADALAESSRPRVVDIVMPDYPDFGLGRRQRCRFLREGSATLVHVTDDGGVLKSDNFGDLHFDRRAVVLAADAPAATSLRQLGMEKFRTVFFRGYAPPPSHTDLVVISVAPLGKVFEGSGVITEMKENCAFVGSLGFGRVFMPYNALQLNKRFDKARVFQQLRGLKVRFRITDSLPGPRQHCRWRAVAVWPE